VALWQIGELEIWEEAARWLARLHRRFGEGDVAERARHLLRHDPGFYRQWPERALSFASRDDDRRRRGLRWLVERYERVVERLETLPVAFIHGEFYASNVLVGESDASGSPRICPIDWELAAIGGTLLDVAALTTGKWSDAERRSLALAYRDALETLGGMAWPAEEFLTALDYCYLHLAVQWLGWAPTWKAPRAHRYDWLGEALRLAEKLDL
jgi:aminoglycoside phosphotransferase (APT) family kinase protein